MHGIGLRTVFAAVAGGEHCAVLLYLFPLGCVVDLSDCIELLLYAGSKSVDVTPTVIVG